MNESDWVVVGKYASRIESDMYADILEQAGIPVLTKGPITGVFGPGFGGATAEGVSLHVPKDRLDEARDLISIPPETE